MLVRAIEERNQRPLGPEPDGSKLSERGQRGVSGRMRDEDLLAFMVKAREMGPGIILQHVSVTDKKSDMT